MRMPELYQRYDEHVHLFVELKLKRRTSELQKLTGEESPDVWHYARVIDGTTEYVTYDLIEHQVYKFLKMRGEFGLIKTEDVAPMQYKELVWEFDGHVFRRAVFGLNFEQAVPRILTSVDEAIFFLNLNQFGTSIQVQRNPQGGMWDLWIAQVNGATAYGNGMAEALTHAWGISRGLWGEDKLPPPQQWRPAFTIDGEEIS
jgi:hypothetical protein